MCQTGDPHMHTGHNISYTCTVYVMTRAALLNMILLTFYKAFNIIEPELFIVFRCECVRECFFVYMWPAVSGCTPISLPRWSWDTFQHTEMKRYRKSMDGNNWCCRHLRKKKCNYEARGECATFSWVTGVLKPIPSDWAKCGVHPGVVVSPGIFINRKKLFCFYSLTTFFLEVFPLYFCNVTLWLYFSFITEIHCLLLWPVCMLASISINLVLFPPPLQITNTRPSAWRWTQVTFAKHFSNSPQHVFSQCLSSPRYHLASFYLCSFGSTFCFLEQVANEWAFFCQPHVPSVCKYIQ